MSTYPIILKPESLKKDCINSSPLFISNANEGYLDGELFDTLNGWFPELLIIKAMGLSYTQPYTSNRIYTPDIIVYDKSTNIIIDVEIDEPWWDNSYSGTREPRHYTGRDDKRNEFFRQMGWSVIRFAEQQVESAVDACAKTIASAIDEFRKERDKLSPKLTSVPNLLPIPQWGKEEAINIIRTLELKEEDIPF